MPFKDKQQRAEYERKYYRSQKYREANLERMREYRQANPEKAAESKRKFYETHPEYQRKRSLIRQILAYGLTDEEVAKLST